MSPANRYRPDVDGLRAVAVFGVILFHLDLGIAPGGFVGVDLFFVISGFLITGLIRDEVLRTGSFDYAAFYVRRIRRLFPALLVTVTATLAIAALLFSPSHLARLGGAAIHALGSVSNIFFWLEADYFDAEARVKPLLHTWSLSVEEQFYLVWPFLFVLVLRLRSKLLLAATLVGMALLSLALNRVFADGEVEAISRLSGTAAEWISDGRSTLFYLLPFRLYEFAIGGALAFLPATRFSDRAHDRLFLIGAGLVLYALLAFSDEILFPSFNALIPCIGAALMIYGGARSRIATRILAGRAMLSIGLISYSLYLVHWPVIVFWQYYTFEAISPAEAVFVVALCLVLAVLMYRFVEQPFRIKAVRSGAAPAPIARGVVALFAGSSVILVLAAASAWMNEGWPWRVPAQAAVELTPPDVPEQPIGQLAGGIEWADARTIGDAESAAARVLVLGDSHAIHLQGAARYLSHRYPVVFTFYTFTGCPPVFGTYKVFGPEGVDRETPKQRECRNQIVEWERFVRGNRFDYVILSARWNWMLEPTRYYDTEQRRDLLVERDNPRFTLEASRATFARFLDLTVKTIQSTGAKAILVGQVPHAGRSLEGCDNVPRLFIKDVDINKRCNHVPREVVLERGAFSNATIRRVAEDNGAYALVTTDLFCADDNRFCDAIRDGTRLKNDADHINRFGSVWLAKRWEQSGDFPFVALRRGQAVADETGTPAEQRSEARIRTVQVRRGVGGGDG